MTDIAVLNQSSLVNNMNLGTWVNAIQRQLREDVAQFWQEADNVNLELISTNSQPPQDAWWMVILDDNQQGLDLGFHELSDSGLPLGKVFARNTMSNNQSVSRVLSHEIIEIIIDPNATRAVQIDNKFYLVEACDPLSLDSLGYDLNSVRVSGFATPAYFRLPPGGIKYDFKDHLRGPCPTGITRGSYLMFSSDGTTWNGQWAPDSSSNELDAIRPAPGSRRERRQRGPGNWRRSTVWRSVERPFWPAPDQRLPMGWVCPVCGLGVSPQEKTCNHRNASEVHSLSPLQNT
jgi:hypothetical protein